MGGLQVDVAGAVSDSGVPSEVGGPGGEDCTSSGGGSVRPLSPVVPGVGVSSIDDDGILGETDNVIDLEAAGVSSEDGISLEVLGANVTGLDGLLDGGGSEGG